MSGGTDFLTGFGHQIYRIGRFQPIAGNNEASEKTPTRVGEQVANAIYMACGLSAAGALMRTGGKMHPLVLGLNALTLAYGVTAGVNMLSAKAPQIAPPKPDKPAEGEQGYLDPSINPSELVDPPQTEQPQLSPAEQQFTEYQNQQPQPELPPQQSQPLPEPQPQEVPQGPVVDWRSVFGIEPEAQAVPPAPAMQYQQYIQDRLATIQNLLNQGNITDANLLADATIGAVPGEMRDQLQVDLEAIFRNATGAIQNPQPQTQPVP